MEVVDLFPRSILKGELPTPLLKGAFGIGEPGVEKPGGQS